MCILKASPLFFFWCCFALVFFFSLPFASSSLLLACFLDWVSATANACICNGRVRVAEWSCEYNNCYIYVRSFIFCSSRSIYFEWHFENQRASAFNRLSIRSFTVLANYSKWICIRHIRWCIPKIYTSYKRLNILVSKPNGLLCSDKNVVVLTIFISQFENSIIKCWWEIFWPVCRWHFSICLWFETKTHFQFDHIEKFPWFEIVLFFSFEENWLRKELPRKSPITIHEWTKKAKKNTPKWKSSTRKTRYQTFSVAASIGFRVRWLWKSISCGQADFIVDYSKRKDGKTMSKRVWVCLCAAASYL